MKGSERILSLDSDADSVRASWRRVRSLGGYLLWMFAGLVFNSHAQLGNGWVQTSHTRRIHLDDDAGLQTFSWTSYKSVCSPTACADYAYDSSDESETFRILDGRSNRSEIRLQNEYFSGSRQFEGYVTFYPPLHDESLFQIFGSTSGATLCMMRGYSSEGGKIRVVGGIGDLVTGVYGVEKRINVIHIQDSAGAGFVQFYIDGVFKGQFSESEGVNTYWKYGCYGTTAGNVPAVVRWRRVRTFRDGVPPGAEVTATPDRVTVSPGDGAASTINVSAFGASTLLALSGVPPGATVALNPASIPGGQGSAVLTITTASNFSTGSYPLTVTAAGGGTNRSTIVTLGVIPKGWRNQDIGGPGRTGGASYTNGVFSVLGGGDDIWGAADGFHLAFQECTGDGTITARVVAQDDTHPWAKSGVMFRESTNAGSKFVGLYLTRGNGVSMQYRSTNQAAAVDHARHVGITVPHWVRLVRAGDSFAGYRSADGVDWLQVGVVPANLGSNALAGLAVTSHDNAMLNRTDFSSVDLPPNFVLNAAPVAQSGRTNTYQVSLTSLNGFSGGVALSAAGLPPGAVAGFNPPSVAGNGSSLLTVISAAGTPAGEFSIVITGTSGGLTRSTTVSLKTSTLPAGWNHCDIGAPALAGSAQYTNSTGVFAVTGAGNDIWNAADQCHFAYRQDTGDLTITARVITEQLTHPFAKAGVMIRESTNGNSRSVSVVMAPTNGVALIVRSSTGATSVNPSGWNGISLPRWVRLVRSGNAFTGYSSDDGLTWNLVAAASVTMSNQVLTGLAVTSHDVANLNAATFDSVATDYPDFALEASPGTRTITAGGTTTYTITVNGTNGYSDSTALVLDGLPAGMKGALVPALVAGSGSSTLTLTTTNILAPDEFQVTVLGIGSGKLREQTVELVVNAADTDDDGVPDWWMQQNFGHPTGQAGDLSFADDDADGDGMTNGREFVSGTDPADPASLLRVISAGLEGPDVLIKWAAVGGRRYVIESADFLHADGEFVAISPDIQVMGEGESEGSFLHEGGATSESARFYRVRVDF